MKKKLSIYFIDFDDIKNPLLSGGQARATFEVGRRLIKLGHKVTVLCFSYPGACNRYQGGIYYKHFGIGTPFIKLNNFLFFLFLPYALRSVKADVIFECLTAPISFSFSPIFTKIPVIAIPAMFEAGQFSKKYHLPFFLVETFGGRFYQYFLAFSDANKKKMEKLNPKVIIRIIPNGVSEDHFSVKTKEGDYGVFIGRIDIFQKGLDLLLLACKSLKAKKMKIIIAGYGPKSEEDKLKRLIASYELGTMVDFVGRVDGAKKKNLLANARFGIYTSRFEDFPLVPLEYASLSKPAVLFDVPGLAWVPETIAIKVKAFDIKALTLALDKIFSQTAFRRKLLANCRPFAKSYGWNTIAAQYSSFAIDVLFHSQRLRKETTL